MAQILVVDDSKSVLDAVSAWLTQAGHDVTSLTTATSTARLLRSKQFDLVITDIFMPDLDGLELLNLIRTTYPRLPCIAMSSVTGALGQLSTAQTLGAVRTLTKPFQSFHLHAAVTDALQGRPTVPSSSSNFQS